MSAFKYRLTFFASLLAFIVPILPVTAAQAAKAPLVEGHFKTKKGEKSNLSGMDCLAPKADGSRLCILIDDELTRAQFATLTADKLVVGEDIALFDGKKIIGKPPHSLTSTEALHCSGGQDDEERDGEAVAHQGNTFYIVGSHGCSRKSKEYRAETFLLTRLEVTADGSVAEMRNSYKLSAAILANSTLAPYFRRDLDATDKGASIEGMAVSGDRLVFAFRSPSIDGNAFLLSVPAETLFTKGAIPASATEVHEVPLGKDIGFRDIESLPGGGFLALTGPSWEAKPDAPYALQLLGTDFSLQDKPLTVSPPGKGSPEAIESLGNGQVLVLSDGAVDGQPFFVPFPAAK
jgi:hypothetical protein